MTAPTTPLRAGLHPIVAALKPSKEQLPAITIRNKDVAVTAGAGAGKTRTLVARYLSLLADGVSPRRIAAITFTRKAAREMRNRVRSSIANHLASDDLQPVDRQMWEEIYTQLDAARIGTIHSLCTELLRAHPAEAGIDPRFSLLEEADSTILRKHAVEAALALAADEPRLVPLFWLFGERRLRDIVDTMLNNRLEAEKLYQSLPNNLLAHWQSHLHKRQAASLQRLMQHETWREAVAELRANVASNPDDALEVLRKATLAALDEAEAAAQWEQKRCALSALDEINLSRGSQKAWDGGKEQQSLVKEALRVLRTLWRGEADLLTLEMNEADYRLAEAVPLLGTLFHHAARGYEQSKDERQALDFDDLEHGALALMENPAVRSRWQAEIEAILVDEYQDTNGRQRDLINCLNGQADKLFMVGDAKQSIYRFRGADVTVFRHERKRIERSGETVTLTTSYRAHAPLMEALNALMQPVLGTASIEEEPWREPFSPLRHHREQAAYELEGPFVEIHLTVGSKSEGALERAARTLAKRIRTLVEKAGRSADAKLKYGDIAILCRASRSFTAYEDALDALGIPYLTVAGRGFYERPEVRDLLNILQALADPTDDLALLGLLRSPVSGLSDVQLYQLWRRQQEQGKQTLWDTVCSLPEGEQPWLAAVIAELNQSAGRISIADLLKAFLDTTDYRAALRLAGQNRALRNVSKLMELAQTSGIVAVEEFLEYISTVRASAGREGEARSTAENAVQIMTVHQAKGLEFPVVVLGDANSGQQPTPSIVLHEQLGLLVELAVSEKTPAILRAAQEREKALDAAEADRLLYVAATRAEDKLLVNGTLNLKKNGQPGKMYGWLDQLAAPCGLDQQRLDCDENGEKVHDIPLSAGKAPVHCSVYEPHYRVAESPPPPEPHPKEAADGWSTQLIAEIRPRRERWEDDVLQSIRRVSDRERTEQIPPHLIGALTHEALASWRFPADYDGTAGSDHFRAWLGGRARERGLLSQAQLDVACQQVEAALDQFRQHPLYREVNRAEHKLHEVPYMIQDGEQFEQGRIDLLFRDKGAWTLVEFKTDTAASQQQLISQSSGQVRRYARAVQKLLGQRPRSLLCILNHAGKTCTVLEL